MKNAWLALLLIAVFQSCDGMIGDDSDDNGQIIKKEDSNDINSGYLTDFASVDGVPHSSFVNKEKEGQRPSMVHSLSWRRRSLSLSLSSENKKHIVKKKRESLEVILRSDSQFELRQNQISLTSMISKSNGSDYKGEPSTSKFLSVLLAWIDIIRLKVPATDITYEDLFVLQHEGSKFFADRLAETSKQHDDHKNLMYAHESKKELEAEENELYESINLANGFKYLKLAATAYEQACKYGYVMSGIRVKILKKKINFLWDKSLKRQFEKAEKSLKNLKKNIKKYAKEIKEIEGTIRQFCNAENYTTCEPAETTKKLEELEELKKKKEAKTFENRLSVLKVKLRCLSQQNDKKIAKSNDIELKLQELEEFADSLIEKDDKKSKIDEEIGFFRKELDQKRIKQKIFYSQAKAYCIEAQQFYLNAQEQGGGHLAEITSLLNAQEYGDHKSNKLLEAKSLLWSIEEKTKVFDEDEAFKANYKEAEKCIEKAVKKEDEMKNFKRFTDFNFQKFIEFIHEKRLQMESPRKKTAERTKLDKRMPPKERLKAIKEKLIEENEHKKISKGRKEFNEQVIKNLDGMLNKKGKSKSDKLQEEKPKNGKKNGQDKKASNERKRIFDIILINKSKKDIYYKTIIEYNIEKRIFDYIFKLQYIARNYCKASTLFLNAFDNNPQLQILPNVKRYVKNIKRIYKKIIILNKETKIKKAEIDEKQLIGIKERLENAVDFVVRKTKSIEPIYEKMNFINVKK